MIIPLQEQHLHKIPQLPSLLCKLRAAILDFILISWLFFKTGGRNEFLTPKYLRIEVLFMIVIPKDQFLHWDPFSVFTHLHCSFNMLNKKIQKVAEVTTKLNLLIYSPRIKLLGLHLYENNTWPKCQNCPSDMQINGSHLEFSIDIIVIFQIYCQK